MIVKLPQNFLDVISSNNGLTLYLDNLTSGKQATPRSWLYEQIAPNQVLKNWLDRLSSLEDGDAFERNVFQFDTSQLEKWGPQGEVPPMSDILESIVMPSFSDSSSEFKAFATREWRSSRAAVANQLRVDGVRVLRPASYQHVIDDMRARDTLESNSGWPLFTRRNKPEVKKQAIVAAETGEWLEYPAIALFRNYNRKTRLVWMYPMATNLVEGSFFQPLQSAIMQKNYDFFAPWQGFEAVRALITRTYDSGKFIAATDFSATDEHFRLSTSIQVFEAIKRCFQKQYDARLLQSIQRMHTIPLIIGPSEMVTGEHGVSSGSNWTNFIETIFDWIFSDYVRTLHHKYRGLYAIGDDMAWVSDSYDADFAEFAEICGIEVGQQVKAEKTTNDPDKVKTLQRLFQRGYRRPDGQLRGVYSTVRALKSSVYPERFHSAKQWSSDMFCARQYMILENCVDHPLFKEFVEFVVKGQKDLIPFAKKSSASLRQITRKSKLVPGLNQTYNQEKRDSSLENFESIAIARTL